ncbi:MAG TPA: beta-propeller domain-containing protein, partial [Pirellulaceae bacterium]|nr:beta-propeller domain-containing protein [Pirellulaceae bacterium]
SGEFETALMMMSWDSETGDVFVSASGHVPGVVHNRFSIDEHDGLIRLVTMSGMWTGNGSGLFVLRQNGTALDVIGEVRGIAPSESVRSVRFFEDEAFIVTFLEFDPLFAIDLSDPTNPHVAGHLELPGFSGYLQMLDDTHLLGIGSDGLEKASLFDVSDLSNPRLLDTYYLNANQTTQSQWDPQAVTWLPDERLLALPVDTTYFSIDESTGIPFATGGVNHGLLVLRLDMTPPDSATPRLAPVGELADDASVTRSWRIGDYLMALSDNGLMSARLDDPTVAVSDLPLTPLQPTQPGGLLFGPSSWFNPRMVHPTLVGSTPGIAEDLQSENGRIAVIVQAATADLAQRLGLASSDVMMTSAEAATWLDGQLGLTDGTAIGEPGESVDP